MAHASSNEASLHYFYICLKHSLLIYLLAALVPSVQAADIRRSGLHLRATAGEERRHVDGSLRPCRDDELAEYALLVSVGPAQTPVCTPLPGQSLRSWSLDDSHEASSVVLKNASKFVHVPAATELHSNITVQRTNRQAGFHFIHVHVVQSDEKWCSLPCDGPSWELSAPKPAKNSQYLLLEAAIWRQFRKITLYKFDAEWEELARESYQRLCAGSGWGCPAYENHREAAALLTVGPWPAELDHDDAGLSTFIKDAFQKVFAEVNKFSGGDNSNVGLTYSGHGGDADGSMFAGAVDSHHAVPLFKAAVDAGGKFPIFNFGTNCKEGRWNMIAALHPFTDWILASDLNVGGLEGGDDPAEDMKHIKAKEKLSDVAVIKRTMEEGWAIKDVVKQIVKARGQLWLGAMKDAITRQKLRQSVSAFVAPSFPRFASSMKSAYQSLSPAQQKELLDVAEHNGCDVLVAARFMDSAQGGSQATGAASFAQGSDKAATIAEAGALESQFRAFRPEYTSTRSLFKWEPVTHGLGFNERGAWNVDGKILPRCDFGVPFGVPQQAAP